MSVKHVATVLSCTDCVMILANGVESDEQVEHGIKMNAYLGTIEGVLIPGEVESDFSPFPCDTCGTTDAGTRHCVDMLA